MLDAKAKGGRFPTTELVGDDVMKRHVEQVQVYVAEGLSGWVVPEHILDEDRATTVGGDSLSSPSPGRRRSVSLDSAGSRRASREWNRRGAVK